MDAEMLNAGTAGVVAELVKEHSVFPPVLLPNGDTVLPYADGISLHTVPNINPALPEDVKASETFVEPASLAIYANMYRTPTTILKASLAASTVMALLDYHEPVYGADGKQGHGHKPVPRRNQHHATYKAEFHPDFVKWRAKLGVLLGQVEYAEFVEDMLHTIGDPPAADLIDALTELKIHRAASFENKVDLRGGKINLAFTEDDKQGGRIALPDHIVVVVPIYQGTEPEQLVMKLRYKLESRVLKLFVVCPGIETRIRDRFQQIAENIRDQVDVPLFYTA